MPFPSKLLSTPVGGQGPVMSLTQHQWDCVNRCNEHFNRDDFALPTGDKKKETAPLTEREKMFLSRDAYLRFLVSVKGDISACIDKLEKAIIWRRKHKIDDFDHWVEKMKFDSDMGKTFLCHFAPDGRPLLYMLCNRDQLPMSKRHPWLVLFCVERATELMANGQTALINIFPFREKQGLPASVSVSRTLMASLGNYYPEVLSRSYVLDAPWQIRTFIGLVWPMVDWSARRKIKICPSEVIFKDGEVPTERLLKDAGGKLDVPWDAEAYWETLISTCRERREDHLQRWRKLGAKCGLEERLFKVVESDPHNDLVNEDDEEQEKMSLMTEQTRSSTDYTYVPPSINAYSSEHGMKQWKDNWSFHGVKSSPADGHPNLTSTSLESQYGLVQRVRENEDWIKKNHPPSSSAMPQRRCSIRRAETDSLPSSESFSSGSSIAIQTPPPQRTTSLRAPQHHPHPHARGYDGSSWTLSSEEGEEVQQPKLYPRPPPPPRKQRSFTAMSTTAPSPPPQRPRTGSLEAEPPLPSLRPPLRPLHRSGRVPARRAATEPGYSYRDEPALHLRPAVAAARPNSREFEKAMRITDAYPISPPTSGGHSSAESDSEEPSDIEETPTPISAPNGMDAFTATSAPNGMDAFSSTTHLGHGEEGEAPESAFKRSSISTVASVPSEHSNDDLSSVPSSPGEHWLGMGMMPEAVSSSAHLALEAQLEADLQAQMAMDEEDELNDDDATIRYSEVTSYESKCDASPSQPGVKRHSVITTTTVTTTYSTVSSMGQTTAVWEPYRNRPMTRATTKAQRSPPQQPLRGMPYLTYQGPFVPHESPPRLPQLQTDRWRFNAPTLGMQPPWAPRHYGAEPIQPAQQVQQVQHVRQNS